MSMTICMESIHYKSGSLGAYCWFGDHWGSPAVVGVGVCIDVVGACGGGGRCSQ